MDKLRTALELIGALYSVASIVVNLPLFREKKWAQLGRRIVAEIGPLKRPPEGP